MTISVAQQAAALAQAIALAVKAQAGDQDQVDLLPLQHGAGVLRGGDAVGVRLQLVQALNDPGLHLVLRQTFGQADGLALVQQGLDEVCRRDLLAHAVIEHHGVGLVQLGVGQEGGDQLLVGPGFLLLRHLRHGLAHLLA